METVTHEIVWQIPVEGVVRGISKFLQRGVLQSRVPYLNHDEVVVLAVFLGAQGIEIVLIKPENQVFLVVVRDHVGLDRCLHHPAIDAAICAIVWILITHRLEVGGLVLDKPLAVIVERDRGTRIGIAHGLVEHIGAEQAPIQFPRITPHHIIEGLCIIRKALIAPWLRLPSHPAQLRRIYEEIHFRGELGV